MNRELLDISGCKKNLVVEIPAAEVEHETVRLAHEYAVKARVPGFRPGKVPLKLIRQRFGSELHSDAVQDLIARTWKSAVQELSLKPISEPAVENLQDQADAPLKFSLSFEVLPTIEIQDYKGISVQIPAHEVTDEDVNHALEALREQQALYIPVENEPIKDGHQATFMLDGDFADGSKPIHEDEISCIVGDEHTDATFSENLRGAKSSDTRAFEVAYPEDYHRKQLAGKRVNYRILIKEVKEKHLAELTDEFAAELGAENLEKLRGKMREDLVRKAELTAEKKAKEAVLADLINRHAFDIPECLVQDELNGHTRRIATDLAMRGVDIDKASIDWKKLRDEGRPFAEQAVRRSLVLDAVAQKETIETTDTELDAELRLMAAESRRSPAALRAQLEKDKKIDGLSEHLRHNKALDFIYCNANISRG